MAKRKRTTSRSGLVGRAVTAGRKALKEAESRVPPDVRKQVERRIRDANKTVQAAIKEAQVQVRRARSRSDVTSFLKRLDGFTKQAKQLARGTSTKRSTTRRAAPARKAATARKPATRKASPKKRPAARAAATPRRRTARTTPAVIESTVPVEVPAEPPMA
jgi:hypothetical protein